MVPMTPLLHVPRIHFDFGAISSLGEEIAYHKIARPLLVTDRNLIDIGLVAPVLAALPAAVSLNIFSDVSPNPTAGAVDLGASLYRDGQHDGLIAVGGGSVIDCAKAVAVLATHPGPISNYLGRAERIVTSPAPLIAVPTTAGTGSEVSRGCGIHPDAGSRALGLNHPLMVPSVAICDPELTFSLPQHLTAATGMDALSHCIEGLLANSANPLVDAIALDGARRIFTYLKRAVAHGDDREARWQVMMAALAGGIAIYKGLGPAHAIANTCGDQSLHHGALVAVALPPVLRLVAAKAPERLRAVAEAIGVSADAAVAEAIAELNAEVGIPDTISALGYERSDLDQMARDAASSFFNRSAPYQPTRDEYQRLLSDLMLE
jgi:4-hydroxybutyrate dehydrogenase